MIKLKGPLARWQGVFDKIMVSGVSGMGASEFSKVSEAVYEDLMNEKTFRQSMNEAYGDLDEVQKRMIVSLGNFSMLGIHHLKGVDFMSTKAKYDLMDAIEIKANNINDKAAEKRGEYTTNDKGEKVLNKEFKSIEEKEKYLTESEKSNLNQYSTDFNMLSQYALNESMSNELDPNQVDQATFEKNFSKRYMDPVNRVLKSFDPEYKAPKILFGNSSKNPSFRENFRSGENSTAEITNDGSRMYFDLKYYTPGKALHEITHLGLQTYYKNKLYELSAGLGGGKQNFNILAPYVLLFTFRHITNPSPSVVKKIARGDKYPSCDIEKYKSQKSQVGIEIGMFSKILTALCLEKELHVSYLLCFPTFRPEKEGWQKINFLKDPLLFSMQIGHKLNNRYKKPIDEHKPEKSDVINWI